MFRRINILLLSLLVTAPVALLAPSMASAQSTAAKILEKSRADAREIEELRKILNGPDQNMRLATFDAMVKSGNEAMRQIAYETGLASADSALRAMAFKSLMMSKDKLHITLAPDSSAPKKMQEGSAGRISRKGNGLVIPMKNKNVEEGTFNTGIPSNSGQVSGLEFVFADGSGSVSMTLQDDNTLSGIARLEHGRSQFKATARLR